MSATAIAAAFAVMSVATSGDSLTDGYEDFFDPAPLVHSFDNALGGTTMQRYVEQDFAGEVIDSGADFVCLMLGTNDAFAMISDPTWYDDVWLPGWESVLQDYADAHMAVIVGVPPPILRNAAAEANLETLRSYLRGLSGVTLVDLDADIQQVPNWQDFYKSQSSDPNGVHFLPPGYQWIAAQFERAARSLIAAQDGPAPSNPSVGGG